MLTLGVGLEASYGARSALLLGSPRHRHPLDPQVGRVSVGGRALSAWPVGTLSVSAPLACLSRQSRTSTSCRHLAKAGWRGVSPIAKHGQAGSHLRVRAPFGARVLNHEKEPT